MDALFEQPYVLYVALLLVIGVLPTVRDRARAAAGLMLTALGLAADRVGGSGSGTTFATINEILMGAGAAVVVFAAIRAWRLMNPPPDSPAARPHRHSLDILLLTGLLCAAFGPHLIMVVAGVFLALVSAAAVALRSGRPRWIGVVALGGVLLGIGFVLLFTILGRAGGRMAELAAGPFSPPAERLLAILLGLGSLALAGVFPFHRAPWRVSLAPVAAILLARLLVPALPGGLGDWEAPAMSWLAVGVVVAALSGRWAAAMVAGGLLGIWSGRPEGVDSGRLLLLFGWLADPDWLPAPWPGGRWAGVWLLAPLALVPFVLGAALQAQVLVSVLALVATAAGFALESRRHARGE